MQDEPTPEELIKAVADFLRNDIAPQISGHAAFKLRVSINALDLVTRQLALEQGSDAGEAARLSALLHMRRSRGGRAAMAGRQRGCRLFCKCRARWMNSIVRSPIAL